MRMLSNPPRGTLGAGAAVALALAALLLAGCFGVGAPAAIAGGAASTVIAEDKLPTDFLAEAVTGQDCNYIRHLDDKGPYCRPRERRVIERPLYCYRTLGGIDCYEERNPYGVHQRTVN